MDQPTQELHLCRVASARPTSKAPLVRAEGSSHAIGMSPKESFRLRWPRSSKQSHASCAFSAHCETAGRLVDMPGGAVEGGLRRLLPHVARHPNTVGTSLRQQSVMTWFW